LEGFFPEYYEFLSFGDVGIIEIQVSRGMIFLNCDNTEQKRSFEINGPVSERHRWAVVGNIGRLERTNQPNAF